jgi:hypothetical protein
MPCDSIQTSALEFKVENLGILKEAVQQHMPGWLWQDGKNGVNYVYTPGGQCITIDGEEASMRSWNVDLLSTRLTDLREAFGMHVARTAAKACGFSFKATSARSFEIARRGGF